MPEKLTPEEQEEEKVAQEEFEKGWDEEDAEEEESQTQQLDKEAAGDGAEGKPDEGKPEDDESVQAASPEEGKSADPEKKEAEPAGTGTEGKGKTEPTVAELAKREHALRSEVGRLRKQLESQSAPSKPSEKTADDDVNLDDLLGPIEEYEPEVADALKKTIGPLRQEVKDLRSKVAQSESTRKQASEEKAMGLVSTAHPGWEETVQSDEFRDWIYAQPSYLRTAAEHSDDPDDMISILSSFKQASNGSSASDKEHEEEQTATGKVSSAKTSRRELQKQSAATLQSKSGTPTSGSAPDTFEAGWNKKDEGDDDYY